MTRIPTYDADTETRAEFIARIAERYEVPMNLIRYESIEQVSNNND